jgi:hypothetical protein
MTVLQEEVPREGLGLMAVLQEEVPREGLQQGEAQQEG